MEYLFLGLLTVQTGVVAYLLAEIRGVRHFITHAMQHLGAGIDDNHKGLTEVNRRVDALLSTSIVRPAQQGVQKYTDVRG